MYSDDDVITLGSKTQDAETVARIAAGDDEYEVQIDEQTDQPATELPPATEPVMSEEVPAGDEPVADPEPAPPAPAAQPPAPPAAAPKRGSFAWFKHERKRLEEENRKAQEELQRLRQPGTIPPAPAAAAPPPKPEETPNPAVAPPADVEPKSDDFELGAYDPAFIKSYNAWAYREAKREDQQSERERAKNEESRKAQDEQTRMKSIFEADQQEIKSRWERTRAEAREQHPDYDQVMLTPAEVAPANDAVLTAVLDQPNSGHVAYWLVKHATEAQRIHKLTNVAKDAAPWQHRQALAQAFAEIGKVQIQMVNEEPAAAEGQVEDEPPAEEPQAAPPAAPPQPRPGVQPPAPRAAAPPKPPAPPARPAAPAKTDPPPMLGGGRSTSHPTRSAEDLAHAAKGSLAEKQLRDMSDEDYRKHRGMA